MRDDQRHGAQRRRQTGELIGAWEWVGAGSGISLPLYPHDKDLMPGPGDDDLFRAMTNSAGSV